jgi:hypothetical protein
MWGGLCCISLTFAYFLVPETKGLSLEQVDMGLVNTDGKSTMAEGIETVEVGNEKSMV